MQTTRRKQLKQMAMQRVCFWLRGMAPKRGPGCLWVVGTSGDVFASFYLWAFSKMCIRSMKLNTLATWCEELTHWKRPWFWERLKAGGERDDRGWDGFMPSPTQWTWVWASSGRWWRTGKPGMLKSVGLQKVGHEWVTEQQQQANVNWEVLRNITGQYSPNDKVMNIRKGRRTIIACRRPRRYNN